MFPRSRIHMTLSGAIRSLALFTMIGASSAALAQSASCERYRAELASLSRGGVSARSAEANAQRYRAEIGRLVGYYRSIGCDRGGFFFRPPADCGPIAARINALQASYQSILNQAYSDPYAVEVRRSQLKAAIEATCDASPETISPGSRRTGAGERLVCVRTCDGAYFPLDSQPQGRRTAAEMCSALCPNAQVSVFRAPFDGGIEEAVSESGQPYMKLPNALRYRKTFDSSCSCKKSDESWAEALKKAERMVAGKKSDVIVTEAISLRMSTPKQAKASSKSAPKDGAQLAEAPAQPTGSSEPETTGSIGSAASADSSAPKKPRVIAPDIIPVPVP